jgi:hypothetical protein
MQPRETPRVSVLMPTYAQASFICRALDSLQRQHLSAWELLIVDDGSPDDTEAIVQPYLDDLRIRYTRLEHNRGLGAALNIALEQAKSDLIAYLPSDDVIYADHLQSLVALLQAQPDAIAAYSGVRHHYNRSASGAIDGEPLQLVQVVHRRTDDRWLTRDDLTTDDLDRMMWAKLREHGAFVGSGLITCEWVDHPHQRHKVIREPIGGINPYRVRYNVGTPLRFHSSVGNPIDEITRYRRFRDQPPPPPVGDALKIVLVGELAYNADRVLALHERGHKLYGVWTPDPHWYTTVGPLPFGHVEDLPRADWQNAIRRIKPDLIYGLLNWQAVPWAHHVMCENPGVPFVWHFKEGPFICFHNGTWPQLLDLYLRSDGQIYSSPEMRAWFTTLNPALSDGQALVLDGDLPKRDWFDQPRPPRLSESDGEIHTVVPGRPIGLHPHVVAELAAQGVHLHFYGDFTQGQWRAWIEEVRRRTEGYLHLHPNVDQEHWVCEFGQYDAGWLHYFRSDNGGEILRANWDDLNYPARMATLAVAGVPLLQADNTGAIVATQTLARERDLGLFFRDMPDLAEQLRERERLARIGDNVWQGRGQFMFDTHVDALIAFFRNVIARRVR